ncbi:hypothetical protein BV322_04565 [Pseudomonas syringae pv. actinidiae]|nr:hypothetical protein BV322_04565 [Pseudomonas syringae pv. actinidiae]
MKYKPFGKTGLSVSQIALGTGNFGTGWGYGADPVVSEAMFNAYAEAGAISSIRRTSISLVSPKSCSAPCCKAGATILCSRPSSPTVPRPTLAD